ncbi:MAG TPA: hypothetical protein DCY93_03785 [Firmicutes bacterium]|nr:hypothetical protein [Bacillota bacterium]
MALLMKKKGNLLLAILMLVFSVAILVIGLFIGPAGKDVPLASLALGPAFSMKDLGNSLKHIKLNLFYTAAWVLPVVTSLLALLLRRYRLVNLLNAFVFAFAFISIFFALLPITGILDILKAFDKAYLVVLGLQGAGLVFAIINTELCR